MPATRNSRRTRKSGDAAVQELSDLVQALIRENLKLKREVEKLAAGAAVSTATKGLNTMRRRIERALGGSSSGRRTQASSRSTAVRTRKPASPEVRAKRLAALAKAREARAAKRAAQGN